MAGIGWKLQRMIDRDSLGGTVGAYLTGVAVTAAPWLLTTAVLTSLRVVAHSGSVPAFEQIERIVTLIYALTVVFSAPIHVVVSRHTADRLYDRRVERIAAPLWRALAITIGGSLLLGAVLMAILGVPLPLAVAGTLLAGIVGAQWLLLAVGSGLSSPLVVLRAFGLGAPLSIVAALAFDRACGWGALGYLAGFALGQLVTLALLVHGIAAALPSRVDDEARLAPAFLEYRVLALSAFAYYLSVWADKVLVWWLAGSDAASLYAALANIAWFSVIPAFGWIYVQIETAFYQRFRGFYDDLEGGAPFSKLRAGAALIATESSRVLRGAAMVQTTVTAIVLLLAPSILRMFGLPPQAVWPFRLALVGASLQVLSLLEILLLYYFDLRREALTVSFALLGGEVVLVTGAYGLGWPPVVGYPVACALAALIGFRLVQRRLGTLLGDTFQAQPFGSAA